MNVYAEQSNGQTQLDPCITLLKCKQEDTDRASHKINTRTDKETFCNCATPPMGEESDDLEETDLIPRMTQRVNPAARVYDSRPAKDATYAKTEPVVSHIVCRPKAISSVVKVKQRRVKTI